MTNDTPPATPPPYPLYPPYAAYGPYAAYPLAPGAPMTYAAYQAASGAAPTTPWATAALICAVCGFLSPIPSGILGVIFGFVALSEIKQSGDRIGGRGLAIAAIIVGIIVVVGYVALIVLYFIFLAALLQSIPPAGWANLMWT